MRRLPALTAAVCLGLVALASLAPAARAQATLVELSFANERTKIGPLKASTCDEESSIPMRAEVTDLQSTDYQWRLFLFHGAARACPTDHLDPDIEELEAFPFEAVTPNAGRVLLTEAVKRSELIGQACAADGFRDRSARLCFELQRLTAPVNTADFVEGLTIDYDTTIPVQAEIVDVRPGNAKVEVEFAPAPDDGESYTYVASVTVCGTASDDADAGTADAGVSCSGTPSEVTSTDPVLTIAGLAAEDEIEVVAFLRDDVGNEGEPAEAFRTHSEPDYGPLAAYDGADNPLSFRPSCAQGGVPSWLWLGLAGIGAVLSWRRRRRRGGAIAVGLVALLSSAAAAPAHAERGFGQQTLSVALSSYKPNIDSERHGGKRIFPIYDCFFDDAQLMELGGESATHLWDGFGSLQLSVGFEGSFVSGKAQPSTVLDTGCTDPTDTVVTLFLLKLRPGLTYRFDWLLDQWSVPLVPYARASLVGAGYMFTKDAALETGGTNPIGMRLGIEGAAGLMVALDFLDAIDPFVPNATQRGRATGTFDHTFVFAEGSFQDISTFGQPGFVLTPVDDFLNTRLPIVWKLGIAVELL